MIVYCHKGKKEGIDMDTKDGVFTEFTVSLP